MLKVWFNPFVWFCVYVTDGVFGVLFWVVSDQLFSVAFLWVCVGVLACVWFCVAPKMCQAITSVASCLSLVNTLTCLK